MIKVCHIVNLITGKSDGVYTHLKMIFQNFDRTKFQHYLIFQGGEKIVEEFSKMGVIVFVSSSLKKKISLKAFIDIFKIIKGNNIDIIHTHLVKPYAIAGLLNIILKKKFIFNYHGIFLKHNPYYNFFERNIYSIIHFTIFLFGKVSSVIVPSEKSKEELNQETKLFPDPVVYYNGYFLNHYFVEPNNHLLKRFELIKKNNMIIAVIGRLEVQKRIDRALKLFQIIIQKKHNLFLIIFGDGKLKSWLQSECRELQIESKTDLLDYVPNLLHYYKQFDVLLFTSDWEGMPLSMWEAMAHEVPIIAPDVGGFKEILEGNNCGLIYEPGNLADAEIKFTRLINDEELRNKLGTNGRAAIEEKYTGKKFIEQLEKNYFILINK